MGLFDKILGGRDDHYCHPPMLGKKAGNLWTCGKCGNTFTYKVMKGRLVALLTRDGSR